MTDQADTPDPIGEWLAAGDKATLGPWVSRADLAVYVEHWHVSPIATLIVRRADGEFIAASRNVVPAVRALAAEVRALRAENERLADEFMQRTDRLILSHADALDRINQRAARATTELAAARDREAAVRALHVDTHGSVGRCNACDRPWPCATVAALSQSEPTKETP